MNCRKTRCGYRFNSRCTVCSKESQRVLKFSCENEKLKKNRVNLSYIMFPSDINGYMYVLFLEFNLRNVPMQIP